MGIDFSVKDVVHQTVVKFVHAFLPEAKKPYYLKAVLQSELDIHGVASKAAVYNIATSPKVIEEGLTAGMELMFYLAADGYKINTPLFNLRLRLPGEYDGSENRLPDGVYPMAKLQAGAALRNYIKERVNLVFDGVEWTDGLIAEAVDEATGITDEVMTIGKILTIHGNGLKIEGGEGTETTCGVFFEPESGEAVQADTLAVNEPRTLKVLVPDALTKGEAYKILIHTQSSIRTSAHLLKEPRSMRSEFVLTAK